MIKETGRTSSMIINYNWVIISVFFPTIVPESKIESTMGSVRRSFGESMDRLWNELSFTPAGEFLFEQGTRYVHTDGGECEQSQWR